jgi:hypothetical protein
VYAEFFPCVGRPGACNQKAVTGNEKARMSPLDTIARTSDAREMRSEGGKGACYRQLINLMPPHRQYIETHLGGGAVMRYKRPATQQVGIDLDPAVINLWRRRWPDMCEIVQGDAIEVLRGLRLDADTVIYADPTVSSRFASPSAGR